MTGRILSWLFYLAYISLAALQREIMSLRGQISSWRRGWEWGGGARLAVRSASGGTLHSGDIYLGHLGNDLKGTPSKCVVWTVCELAL